GGIALATGKPAVGVTTLAAVAGPFFEADESLPLLAAIDARHERVYMQLFGPDGRSLVAPRMASIRHAIRAAIARPTRIVGNAAKLIEEAWPDNERRPPSVSAVRAADVAWVAKLGAAADDLTAPVRPLYLGDADAHLRGAGILPGRCFFPSSFPRLGRGLIGYWAFQPPGCCPPVCGTQRNLQRSTPPRSGGAGVPRNSNGC